jgi:integrase
VARTVRDSKLGSPSAREKLATQTKPYWRSIEKDLHLGYRKGIRERVWIMRRYVAGKYSEEPIGHADDRQEANGNSILTFGQAMERARARARTISDAANLDAMGPALTVATVVEEYVIARERREAGAGIKKEVRTRLRRHVLSSALAGMKLAGVTPEDLSDWRRSLKMGPGGVRRITNDFKAALNASAKRYASRLPPRFRDTVKDGLASEAEESPVAREAQILPDADVRALIEAAWAIDAQGDWGGDLARLVLLLAATGARFSQVQRLTVADVQFAEKRLMMPSSRKGRVDKPRKPTPIRVGDDVLEALRPATNGRKGHETLLLRPRWRQVGPVQWERYERGPWRSASELTRPWAAIVARAGLAPATVPYALRHSSIIRGLRAGLPIRLVAQLHDTSVAMIESHYAAYVADAMDDLTAKAIIPLTTASAEIIDLPRQVGGDSRRDGDRLVRRN